MPSVGTATDLATPPSPTPTRLVTGPARTHPIRSRSTLVLEAFFITLMVLVCVGSAAFAGLTVKKLYQGQR
jgi:hypothetical protein